MKRKAASSKRTHDKLKGDTEDQALNSRMLDQVLSPSAEASDESSDKAVDADIERTGADIELTRAREELAKTREELTRYKDHYIASISQRDELNVRIRELEQQLVAARNDYAVISDSACWKMTKPLRAFLDFLKRFPLLLLMIKALKCLKQNGVAYTWRKVKRKLNSRKQFVSLAVNRLYIEEELERQRKESFSKHITISIVVPLYNTPEVFLKEMIQSVRNQTYGNWELCMADGSDEKHTDVGRICHSLARSDKRIKYRKLDKNLGISGNTNACLDMATGDYVGLFDHDDLLHPAALYEVMRAICDKGADFIYTDEATFESPDINKIITAHFKPDFAWDNLRANNYICHLTVFKRDLMEKSGKFRPEYDGSQDHDLMLRLTENAQRIVHIPKILYYWRSHPQSTAMDIGAKEYAITAGKNAVKESIAKAGYTAEVESSRAFPTIYRVKYELKGTPRVSIIIPNKNHSVVLKRCLDSIFEKSTYRNYEIVIIDNGSDEKELFAYYQKLERQNNIKILHMDDPFNYPKLNNYAAERATGEYLILLNNDIEVISPEWIEEMLMYAQRPEVGAVGAMLYYPDDTIQHAGIILGLGADRVAGHAFYRENRQAIGYMGRLCYAQDYSAVTAACMMVKASVYREVQGMDEQFQVSYNDVDFCMRIRKAGYLIVWTPYAELYHYESLTRGREDTPEKRARFEKEAALFRKRWEKELAAGDPYYNPSFTLDRSDFSLRE